MIPAAEYFRAKLQFEIDVMEVAENLRASDLVLVYTRRRASWDHGRVPGAVHLPTAEIPERAPELIPVASKVVVYSWGPDCNGSTFAAFAFAELDYAHAPILAACAHRFGRFTSSVLEAKQYSTIWIARPSVCDMIRPDPAVFMKGPLST